MRISDWSSDVCSSDLTMVEPGTTGDERRYAEALVTKLGTRLDAPLYDLSAVDVYRPFSIAPDCLARPSTARSPKAPSPRRSSAERRVGQECVSTCRSRW